MTAASALAVVGGRRAVLDALWRAGRPVSAAELACDVDLHPNTVRGHLELLTALGYATRVAEERTTRGRPRVLYCAVRQSQAGAEDICRLATVLAIETVRLGAADQASAPGAGRQWAASLARQGRIQPCEDADDALEQAAELYAELGFGVATEPLGDRLYLTRCPYADQIEDFPGICEVHCALLCGVFAETGEHATLAEMLVGVRPGLCVALLKRTSASPVPRRSDD